MKTLSIIKIHDTLQYSARFAKRFFSVVGDLLLLKSGTNVAADVRLVEAEEMKIDMSSFTGESAPVERYVKNRVVLQKRVRTRKNAVSYAFFFRVG